jgi:hypothetical protein
MANAGYGCGRNFNFITMEYHYIHINAVFMDRKNNIIIRKNKAKYIGVAGVVGVVIWPTLAIALADIYILEQQNR